MMNESHKHRLLNSEDMLLYDNNLIDEGEFTDKILDYLSKNRINPIELLDNCDVRKMRFYLKVLLKNSSTISRFTDGVLEFSLKQFGKDKERADIIGDIFLLILFLNEDLISICKISREIESLLQSTEHRDISSILQQLKLLELLIDVLFQNEIPPEEIPWGFEMLDGLYKILRMDIHQLQPRAVTCIKRIINYKNIEELLHITWNKIKQEFLCETKVYFTLLCSLADYFVNSMNATNIYYNITGDEEYWFMLQSGIISNDSLIRKQALYLLKRSIDDIVIQKNDIVVPVSLPRGRGNIFFWKNIKSTQLEQVWKNMFVILDTLEEKQSHLILPTLNLLLTLKCLHESWMYLILQLIIRHENNNVLKWGIMYILENIKLDTKTSDARNLLTSLLKSLNDTVLYQDSSIHLLPIMIKFVSHIRDEVLMQITLVNWASVPLFYLTRAILLSEQISQNSQNLDINLIIKLLVDAANETQNVYIRSAIKINILKIYINSQSRDSQILRKENEILYFKNIYNIPRVLGEFDGKGSLKRGTQIWDEVVTWLKCSYCCDTNEVLQYIFTNKLKYETKDIAKFVVIMLDAEMLSEDAAKMELKKALTYFDECHSRPYASTTIQFFSVDLLLNLLEEIHVPTEKKNLQNTRRVILSVVSIIAQKLAIFIRLKLSTVVEYNDWYIIEKCMQCLKLIANESILFSIVVPQLETDILYSSTEFLKSANVMQKFFYVLILEFLQNYYSIHKSLKIHCNNISDIFVASNKLGNIFETRNKQDGVASDQYILCGKIASLYHESLSKIRAVYVRNIKSYNDCNIKELLNSARDSLEVGSRDTLMSVQDMIQCILPHILEDETCINIAIMLVEDCWKRTFQLKRTEIFRDCMKKFVDMTFQVDVVNSLYMKDLVKKYASEILEQGKSIRGLANILLEVIYQRNIYFDGLVDVLVDGLLFGNLIRKDQRIENETCLDISNSLSEVNDLVKHDVTADLEVRVLSALIILNLLKFEDELSDSQAQTVKILTIIMLERSFKECKNKTRYYADSQHHRFKQRILQSLLILQPFWDEKLSIKILNWLVEELIIQTQQPSVRYLQEWLIARILKSSKNIEDTISKIAEKISEGRPGAISSAIIVMYLLVKNNTNCSENCDELIEQSINITLPWAMGQNFTARLYAQLTIRKMLELGFHTESFKNKFEFLSKSIEQVLSIGNAAKNAKKMQNDIFLSDFDICRHYSIETIFYDLPRVTNYVADDLISPNIFEEKFDCDNFKNISLRNKDNVMAEAETIVAGSKALQSDCDENVAESSNVENYPELSHYNVQKKIVPWQRMDVVDFSLSASECFLQKKESSGNGLVVVASLVGRAPNLGGLARTCEVFGVQEYVIESLKYIEEKQFQSLSVSAEKWINITEVKSWQLPQYIETMRRNGYCIAGAEQTTGSQSIYATSFPKRTVLILGNEKEGIPVTLLPLLDLCVEIPQTGIVRSLNVHVTGALFIWEYMKQHLKTSS